MPNIVFFQPSNSESRYEPILFITQPEFNQNGPLTLHVSRTNGKVCQMTLRRAISAFRSPEQPVSLSYIEW